MNLPPPSAAEPAPAEVILSRAQRAHARLSWEERRARNARKKAGGQIVVKLFGVPEGFTTFLEVATAERERVDGFAACTIAPRSAYG